ncbi:MAG: UvrD-helicase domain-containing protein [Bacteroidales bacterium]|nr:UvrD-helicase domain-containing protein [Bacteroidales bacterium]
MSKLKIYKASAGSGKTFKLTEEFILLLFKNPLNYKNILAVTFTNKATGEMKSRIIGELYNLTNNEQSPYLNILKKEFNQPETEIREKAKLILNNILHDYSRFSVETIDSFFQQVIRSFTKELGLQSGFNIELDNSKVLKDTVDSLFFELEKDQLLTKWLINFAEDKIEKGSSWNLKKELYKFGYEIFTEQFQLYGEKLIDKVTDKKFLKNYLDKIYKIKSAFENQMQQIGKQALKIIEDEGLTTNDFSYGKSGFANYFNKLNEKIEFFPGKRAIGAIDNIDNWYSKDSINKEKIINTYNAGLNNLLNEANETYNKNSVTYYTCEKIYVFIYALGILTDIFKKLREINKENNIFLLSDSSKLLMKIIDENDSPFIYEKTGSFYKHFMIDEFQDTSKLQWNNFKPLIYNSLSEDNKSLVVGDVKQAIYRWRNSDWKLLADKINDDFNIYGIDINNLEYNWRSKKNIIVFNNFIFNKGANLLQDNFNNNISENNEQDETLSYLKTRITSAYKNIEQKIPSGKSENEGYICSAFIKKENKDIWKQIVLSKLPGIIENLQDNNYKLKDIAILVRRKKDGTEITKHLLQYKNSDKAKANYKYDVISEESLYINNSSAVNFIILLLKYLTNPKDNINRTFLINEYYNYLLPEKNKTQNNKHKLVNDNSNNNKLPEYFPAEFTEYIDKLRLMPLFQLIEKLIQIFSLGEIDAQIIFIQAFQDKVIEFSGNNSSDIDSFLSWWEEHCEKESINFSEQHDAIRVLTIHKSKGLEFKAVIIPFCDWNLDNDNLQTNILWCQPKVEPFNELELVPVRYSSVLSKTIFYQEYYEEKLSAFVDNLNLLYVAFTRAKNVLFTFSPYSENKSDKMKKVSNLLYNSLNIDTQNKTNDFKLHTFDDDDIDYFEFGKLDKIEDDNKTTNYENIYINSYPSGSGDLRIKLHSKDYFKKDTLFTEQKINYGILMHQIFEQIRTINDVETIIEKYFFEGKINKTEAGNLKNMIHEALKDTQVKSWFTDEWEIKAETSILLKDGKIKRPDRVMISKDKTIVIDFKFGFDIDNNHKIQVSEYVDILKEMGYKNINGYIWYVSLKKVVGITLS